MDFYTLDSNFLKNNVIDKFTSAIWTERYSSPGDVNLVVDASPSMISKLKEGTFLSHSKSNEVMIIDTQSIDNGKLTLTGASLLDFLRNRPIYAVSIAQFKAKSWVLDGYKPGELIGYIVKNKCTAMEGGPDPPQEGITNLTLGAIDPSGSALSKVSIPFGSVFDGITPIANQYALGMSLYLESASALAYSLKFKVYKGVDRSNTIIFSPELDSLSNIKELRSNRDYKTYGMVVAINEPDPLHGSGVEAEAYPGAASESGFIRRSMVIILEDLTIASVAADPDVTPTPTDIANFEIAMIERGKQALAEHNYVKIVDGEVTPASDYEFGIDYNLGDIVKVQGYSGLTQNVRVTEYIRSQDVDGERAYPTVEAID